MTKSLFNRLSSKSRIGISVTPDSLEGLEIVQEDKYLEVDIKRTTKANSFMVMPELYYIAKKAPSGKASGIYHVYRVSDKRYICPAPFEKDDAIRIVMEKIIDMDL